MTGKVKFCRLEVFCLLPTLFLHHGCAPDRKSLPSMDAGNTGVAGNDGESTDVPNNISGVYLTCQSESKPTTAKPEAVVGCFMAGGDGKRVEAQKVAQNVEYGFMPPTFDAKKFAVYALKLSSDPQYDSVYVIKANSSDDLGDVSKLADQTMVTARFDGFQSGTKPVVLGGRISGIIKNPDAPATGISYDSVIKNLECEHSLAAAENDPTKVLTLTIVNQCDFDMNAMWVDYSCGQLSYGVMNKGGQLVITTYIGHPWRFFRVSNGVLIDSFKAIDNKSNPTINLCGG